MYATDPPAPNKTEIGPLPSAAVKETLLLTVNVFEFETVRVPPIVLVIVSPLSVVAVAAPSTGVVRVGLVRVLFVNV